MANTSFPANVENLEGHNENSLWQLLFIHSLVVCSDLGDLPKFCSENFQKTGKWLVYFSVHVTLIENKK